MKYFLVTICAGIFLPAAGFATDWSPADADDTMAIESQTPGQDITATNPSEASRGPILDLRPIRHMKGIAVSYWPAFLAFSPGGETLTLAAHHVFVWDVATGKELHHWHEKGWVAEGLSRDGATVAILNGRDGVHLIQTRNGRERCQLQGNHDFYSGAVRVTFSRDASILAAYLPENGGDSFHFWETATGKELAPVTSAKQEYVSSFAMSPDGKILAKGGGAYIELYDLTSQRVVRRFGVPRPSDSGTHRSTKPKIRGVGIVAISFSPNGRILAASDNDGNLDFWEVATGNRLRHLSGGPRSWKDFAAPGVGLAFSDDGRRLVSLDIFPDDVDDADDVNDVLERYPIHLWDVAAGQPIGRLGQSGRFKAIAFSPNGRLLASVSDDGTVTIWDISALISSSQVSPSAPLPIQPDSRP